MDHDRIGAEIDVRDLLAPERAALVELLGDLEPHEWALPSPCPAWSVHELALHVVHDDLRRLSAERDGHAGAWLDASTLDELVVGLDELNERWVAAVAPNVSPRLTVDWLRWLAAPSQTHLLGLDPQARGGTVAWAGVGPHPNWLDIAREYTERWVHQQQIRDAVGRPGLREERFVAPIVETFARALPVTLPVAPPATEVVVRVVGAFERGWVLRADTAGWSFAAASDRPSAVFELPVEVFWRRAVRLVDHDTARRVARFEGDQRLVEPVLGLRGAIVPDTAGPAPAPAAAADGHVTDPSDAAIVVAPHQPDWAESGATMTAWLRDLAVPGFVRADHIGSTSIPQMAAKAVLDVQLSVTDLDAAAASLDRELAPHGFVRSAYERDHVPAGRTDDPGAWSKRLWTRRGHPGGDVNLHVRLTGSPGERFALLFRDWFREHPDAVPAYEAFKRTLATHVGDVGVYSEVKDPVVDLVIVTAERWAAEVGWTP